MLVSNNEQAITKSRFWATQSRDQARHYQHSELGFNYRMSNVVAGIGRGQLKVLEQRVQRKKEIFEFYRRELAEIEDITFMPVNEWDSPNYWLSCATIEGDISPEDVMNELEKYNVESRPVWKPMHLQPYFEEYDYIGRNVANTLFEKGICLPSDTKMTDEDLLYVVNVIRELWSQKNEKQFL